MKTAALCNRRPLHQYTVNAFRKNMSPSCTG